MPKFICQNKKCKNYGKVEHFTKVRYRWNPETLRLEADESFCPVCKVFREPVREYTGWSDAWFKAESNRNYNNKKVAQFDYDRSVREEQTVELPKNFKR